MYVCIMIYIVLRYTVYCDYIVLIAFYGKGGALRKSIEGVHIEFLTDLSY